MPGVLIPSSPLQASKMLHMLTPGNVRVDLQTSAYADVSARLAAWQGAAAHIEPWFQVDYCAAPLPPALMQQ